MAKERNEAFQQLYIQTINKFTGQFITDFCKKNGDINWEKFVEFNSGMKKNKK